MPERLRRLIEKVFAWRPIRYLIAGGTAFLVNIGLLFIFVDIFGLWYLIGTTLAFLGAMAVSFTMQKFLTFAERSFGRIPGQLAIYLVVNTTNLFINGLLMYLGVDILHIHYLVAQILTAAAIALYTFFIYKHFIFHHLSVPTEHLNK